MQHVNEAEQAFTELVYDSVEVAVSILNKYYLTK